MLFIFLTSLSLSISVLSYVPSSDFILNKVVQNHGSGNYLIEQEVTFMIDNIAQTISEIWHIRGINYTRKGVQSHRLQWHLLAKGEPLRIQRIYSDNTVYEKNTKGTLQKRKYPPEFIEPWFTTRSLSSLQNAILRHQIAGTSALYWNPSLFTSKITSKKSNTEKNLQAISMPISLSRSQGRVMYTYQRDLQGPGLWIEQDKFLIRKIKLKTGTEISANEYSDYGKDLKFPKVRTITFDNNISVSIRVLKINVLSQNNKSLQNKMSPQALRRSYNQQDEKTVPLLIKDFYLRFR